MEALRWVVLVLAVVLGGWMLYDGARALVLGDYTTPAEGPHRGRLGPWADLVERTGVAPRGTPMKVGFVAFGALWLAVAIAWILRASWAASALLVLCVATLWYLPVGTVIVVLIAALVLWLRQAG